MWTSKLSLRGYAGVRGEEGLGTFQQEDSAESKGPGGSVTVRWVRRRGSGEMGAGGMRKGWVKPKAMLSLDYVLMLIAKERHDKIWVSEGSPRLQGRCRGMEGQSREVARMQTSSSKSLARDHGGQDGRAGE